MTEEIESMTKSELLEQIRSRHERLENLLARLSPGQMLQPGVSGEWSVKDVLAHLSAWERRMVGWVGMLMRGEIPAGAPENWDDIHRMNAESYARDKHKPPQEVLAEFRAAHLTALDLAESLSEAQLQTDYPDTWPRNALWHGVAVDAGWHSKEHCEEINKWLKNR
jgi:hypothetical protein